MNTATNSVVQGNMTPVTAAPVTQQVTITGQYLFDNFMGSGEENVTKMNIVRLMARQSTAEEVKKALSDMVELAHKIDVRNGVPEKERGPKRANAMNVRSVMQNVYGALRLAPKEMTDQGYSDRTGYQDAAVMARVALKKHGVKWNGTKLPNEESKALAVVQAKNAARREAMIEAVDANPQADGEDDTAYAIRISKARDELLAKQEAEAKRIVVNKVVAGIVQKYGRGEAQAIADALILFLTSTENVSPEMVDEMLRKAGEAEAQAEATAEQADEEEEEEHTATE